METVSKRWRQFKKTVCPCTECQRAHKSTFYGGAYAFMRAFQDAGSNSKGEFDAGPFMDANIKDFEDYFAEVEKSLPPRTSHH